MLVHCVTFNIHILNSGSSPLVIPSVGAREECLELWGAPFPEKSGIVNLSKIGSGTNWIKYFCQTPDLDSIRN